MNDTLLIRLFIFILALVLTPRDTQAQNAGIGTGSPDPSAVLDIGGEGRGWLMPRMTTALRLAISHPAHGLLVHDTTAWQLMLNRGTPAAPDWQTTGFGKGWTLAGNAGTAPADQFVGTRDARPLRFGIYGVASGKLDSIAQTSAWGLRAEAVDQNGVGNTALGTDALSANNGGRFNTAIGFSALSRNQRSDNNTSVGAVYYPIDSIGPQPANTVLGVPVAISVPFSGAGLEHIARWLTGNSATFSLGPFDPSNYPSEMRNNTLIGGAPVAYAPHDDIGFGVESLSRGTTAAGREGTGATAIGYSAQANAGTVSTGAMAVNSGSTFYNSTATGYSALGASGYSTHSNVGSNTATGANSLSSAISGNNTAIGQNALHTTSGVAYGAVGIGVSAAYNNLNGIGLTAVGTRALFNNVNGSRHTAAGFEAMRNTTGGNSTTAIGAGSMYNTGTTDNNTGAGYNAGRIYTQGAGNTLIGANCNIGGPNLYNDVAVGQDITLTASNQVQLGNAATYSIGGYADWSIISDGRYKHDVQENVGGLPFVLALRPVTYHLAVGALQERLHRAETGLLRPEKNIREKESLRQSGFVAQEVERAAAKLRFDFGGVEKPQNDADFYRLRYEDFLAPLVRSVQQQQELLAQIKTAHRQAAANLEAIDAVTETLRQKIEALRAKHQQPATPQP